MLIPPNQTIHHTRLLQANATPRQELQAPGMQGFYMEAQETHLRSIGSPNDASQKQKNVMSFNDNLVSKSFFGNQLSLQSIKYWV